MKHYKAPWGTLLVVMSAAATVLCLGLSIGILAFGHGPLPWVGLLPLVLILGAAMFTIRGYTITPDEILVHRLLWSTRLSRAGLLSAAFEPNAMQRSLRTCGNGGLFSFTGYYRNKSLGAYRALVTDLQRTVVLRYADRTVVVSPEMPEEFVGDLRLPNGAGIR